MKRAMKYWALLSGGITLAGVLLWSRFRWEILLTIAITAGTVFYHTAVRLLIDGTFDRFLNNRTDYRKRWYQVAPWENALYEKLRVKG